MQYQLQPAVTRSHQSPCSRNTKIFNGINLSILQSKNYLKMGGWTCADPESFFRGVQLFLANKCVQIPLKSGHHRRWRADDGPTLNAL